MTEKLATLEKRLAELELKHNDIPLTNFALTSKAEVEKEDIPGGLTASVEKTEDGDEVGIPSRLLYCSCVP